MTKEIVVAKYNENLFWLEEIKTFLPEWNITIYDKSERPLPNSIPRPNVGRESETYVYHIAKNYDTLADITFFTQGYPHTSEYITPRILQQVDMLTENIVFHTLNEPKLNATCNETGGPCDTVPLTEYTKEFLPNINIKLPYKFSTGACFFVNKQAVRLNSRQFYINLHNSHYDPVWPRVPWTLERLWYYIFTHNED